MTGKRLWWSVQVWVLATHVVSGIRAVRHDYSPVNVLDMRELTTSRFGSSKVGVLRDEVN